MWNKRQEFNSTRRIITLIAVLLLAGLGWSVILASSQLDTTRLFLKQRGFIQPSTQREREGLIASLEVVQEKHLTTHSALLLRFLITQISPKIAAGCYFRERTG